MKTKNLVNELMENLRNELEVNADKLNSTAANFMAEMKKGLEGKPGSLGMLPSYLGQPTGNESGVYFTVDMGGTNLRGAKFQLNNRNITALGEYKNRLKDPDGKYDYKSRNTTAEDLFDYFAETISKVVDEGESGYLGHTFSFPSQQTGINEAKLLKWTKEIEVTGVVGNNPNKLLKEALVRKNIHLDPCVILNDTVGTLLVAAYMYPDADVGSIMGTGHNTCYFEPKHPLCETGMIVNMESGNFNIDLPTTKYDRIIDIKSVAEGSQLLEKMVSGHYIGEVVRHILLDFCEKSALNLKSTEDIDLVSGKGLDSLAVENFILHPDKTPKKLMCTEEEAQIIKEISELALRRAVRLVSATFIGTLRHIDGGDVCKSHTIAVDGTVFEKMPGVPQMMEEAFRDALGDKANMISVKLVKDGSGIGAAIASAMVKAGK